jgi:alanyl-tRNA synthetase
VDALRKADITRHHTATHLLHAALRNHLGTHVQQRGSLVAPDRLRFDFSHDGHISAEHMAVIEREVTEQILADKPVATVWKSIDQAKSEGAMALFGEKYGSEVRTVAIGEGNDRYSYELCGGNHFKNTAFIGSFVITQETAVAQGIRRIEALTGTAAQRYVHHRLEMLNSVARQLQVSPETIVERVDHLQDQLKAQQDEINALYSRLARADFEQNLSFTQTIKGVNVLVARISPTTADTLREMTDWFREKYPEKGVIVLGMVADNGNPQLIAAVTKDLTDKLHAGNIIRDVAKIVGGGGGGRPNLAQAGGKDAEKLPEALETAEKMILEMLG